MSECWLGLSFREHQKSEECSKCINKTCIATEHLPVKVVKTEWYNSLKDEIAYTIQHHQSMAMETVKECWYAVGKAILNMQKFMESENLSVENVVQRVARDLKKEYPDRGMGKRNLYYAIAFYRKFPDKDRIPTKSWRKIIEEDLTDQKQIEHDEEKVQCPKCGTMVKKEKLE